MFQFPETQMVTMDMAWIRKNSGFADKIKEGKAAMTGKVSISSWEPDQDLLDKFEAGAGNAYLNGNA